MESFHLRMGVLLFGGLLALLTLLRFPRLATLNPTVSITDSSAATAPATTTATTTAPTTTATALVASDFPAVPILGILEGEILREIQCGSEECLRLCGLEARCSFWVQQNATCFLKHGLKGYRFVDARSQVKQTWSPGDLWVPISTYLQSLEQELLRPCPKSWSVNHGLLRPKNQSRVEEWVSWALQMPGGQMKLFVDEEIIVSTKTCYDPTRERAVPSGDKSAWFLAGDGTARPLQEQMMDLQAELSISANQEAFQCIKKPRCPHKYGNGFWDYRLFDLHYRKVDFVKNPVPRVAYIVADMWSNIAHNSMTLAFLDAALQLGPLLRNSAAEIVLSAGALTKAMSPYSCMVMEAMSSAWKVHLQKSGMKAACKKGYQPPGFKKGKVRCYEVAVQKLLPHAGNPSPASLRDRVMAHCGFAKEGMRRKIIMHYKTKKAVFWDLGKAKRLLEAFAKERGLDFLLTELSAGEVSHFSACEQAKLFTDTALYIDVHGAAGAHALLLPPNAVFVEIHPSKVHYWSEAVIWSDVLYLHFDRVVLFGGTWKKPSWAWLDWEGEFMPTLRVLYDRWLSQHLKWAKRQGS